MRMNKIQRYILIVMVPAIVVIAALGIASSMSYPGRPFEWGETGAVWVIALVIITIFEYFMFRERL